MLSLNAQTIRHHTGCPKGPAGPTVSAIQQMLEQLHAIYGLYNPDGGTCMDANVYKRNEPHWGMCWFLSLVR
jgi:hypothetical protein